MGNTKVRAFAAYSIDEKTRRNSSSGGIFTHLAQQVLNDHGAVYGVSMTEDCKSAYMLRINSEDELFKLRGSKYLQAKMGDSFQAVKRDLENHIKVLFSGTACQINGLRLFLQNDYDNLYCIDIICHGTPSQKLWKKYVDSIVFGKGAKLQEVSFRCKDKGWSNFGMKVRTKNKSFYRSMGDNAYMQMFLSNLSLRPSCYQCQAKMTRYSDLTMADFWKIDEVAPEMNDNKGISLVIIRSPKGKALFDAISAQVRMKEVTYEDGVKGNPSEYSSVKRPDKRNDFYKDAESMSFSALEKKYAPKSIKQKTKILIKDILYALNENRGGGVTDETQ